MRKWDTAVTAPEAPAPAFCPSCGARELTTTSKSLDASTYWRCVKCGEVWNVARREAGARRPYRTPGTYW
jgi:predicted RNA-binding Zn-ribbon protein involved in translation (DUF1610 family)